MVEGLEDMALREAQAVLQRQLDALRDLDAKAAHLQRTCATLLSLLIAGLAVFGGLVGPLRIAVALSRAPGLAVPLIAGLLAGAGLLVGSLVGAALTHLQGSLRIGLSGQSLRAVLAGGLTPAGYLRASLEAYARGVEANELLIRRAALLFRRASLLFLLGVAVALKPDLFRNRSPEQAKTFGFFAVSSG